MFFQIGQVHRVYNSKMDGEVGGYFYVNPVGGVVVIAGIFSVMALPPSGLFMSELLIFKSYFSTGNMWVGIIILVLLTVIMFTLTTSVLKMLFIRPKQITNSITIKISPWESVSQLFLLGTTFYIGIMQPTFITDLIYKAIAVLP